MLTIVNNVVCYNFIIHNVVIGPIETTFGIYFLLDLISELMDNTSVLYIQRIKALKSMTDLIWVLN